MKLFHLADHLSFFLSNSHSHCVRACLCVRGCVCGCVRTYLRTALSPPGYDRVAVLSKMLTAPQTTPQGPLDYNRTVSAFKSNWVDLLYFRFSLLEDRQGRKKSYSALSIKVPSVSLKWWDHHHRDHSRASPQMISSTLWHSQHSSAAALISSAPVKKNNICDNKNTAPVIVIVELIPLQLVISKKWLQTHHRAY